MLSYELATDHRGSWRVVFVPEELHLYVEFTPADGTAAIDWIRSRTS